MDQKFILSIFVTVFSLALVLIGLPAQITKNYREKRSGQPAATILIALGFYISQIAFFSVTRSYLPLVSFALGTVMWSVTLIQYFLYRNNPGL